MYMKKEILELAVAIITALGGYKLITYFLNLNSNRRISAAEAFNIERAAFAEDYNRVQKELDDLKKKVDELYVKIHNLEDIRLDLISQNNELKLALKEAEKHVCMQPDDRCLQRLNPNDKCRLRNILRGNYRQDHPDAILTVDDMMKGETKNDKDSGIPEEPREG